MKTLKQRALSQYPHNAHIHYLEKMERFLMSKEGLFFKKKFKKEAKDILKAEKEMRRSFKKNHNAGLFFKEQKEILKQWIDCIKKIERDFECSNILELKICALQQLKKKQKST